MNAKVTEYLVEWDSSTPRDLPWKQYKDPYSIWLSEVILQQTKVETGVSYFLAFKKRFPNVFELAKSDLSEVMKTWQGLGYYSRARNMHATAKLIVDEHGGEFPSDYLGLLALKGIGPYTAAAISSFAFNQAHAVVDGNVYRVLARVFGEYEPIHTAKGKKRFQHLADSLLPKEKHAEFNQAIMNFGALICKPRSPLCSDCLINEHCYAFKKGVQKELPIRKKLATPKERHFLFFLLRYGNQVVVEERIKKDVWQNLYQLPMIELESFKQIDYQSQIKEIGVKEHTFVTIHKNLNQRLSHQIINAEIVELNCLAIEPKKHQLLIEETKLSSLPFPRLLTVFLKSFLS